MIKLIKILSEIKIVPNITPEMVDKLWDNLNKVEQNLYDYENIQDEYKDEYKNIDYKYFKKSHINFFEMEKLNKIQLNNYYKDLIELYNKYKKLENNLQEIKITGPLGSPIDVISIESDGFDDDEYEYIDENKVKDIIYKYFNYLNNLVYYGKKVKLNTEVLNNLIDEYCQEANDVGDIEPYKNMTIKDLLDDFKLHIKNSDNGAIKNRM